MDTEHLSVSDIEKFTRRELTPDRILIVARHLGTCAECAKLALRPATPEVIDETLGLDDLEHPDVDTELMPYAGDELPASRRAEIAEHLRSCARCSEDVGDFQWQRAEMRRRPRLIGIVIATAAAAAAVIFFMLTLRPNVPKPLPVTTTHHPIARATGYGRGDWDAAIRDALRDQRIAAPAILHDVREKPDVLRGPAHAIDAKVSPAGVVIDETMPRFTWTAFKGARYTVSVFAGEAEVAASNTISTNQWTPAEPLERGRSYSWQVEVHRGAKSFVIPAPPMPAAIFHVIDDGTSADLADAQRRFPQDHLLLGVLAARAGLQSRAEEELRASASPAAPQILESIRRW